MFPDCPSTTFAATSAAATWLSRRLPGALEIVWDSFEKDELLAQRLPLLAT